MRLKLTQTKSGFRLLFASALFLALSTQVVSAQEQKRQAEPEKRIVYAAKKGKGSAAQKTSVAVRPVKVQANGKVVKLTKGEIIQQKLAAATDPKEREMLQQALKAYQSAPKGSSGNVTQAKAEVPAVDTRKQKANLTVPAAQ